MTSLFEDRLAISELVAAYGDAVSRRDAAAWGATWAADATWNLMGHEVSGRDAIVALWLGAMAQFEAVSFIGAVGPISLAGDRATARCQTHEVLRTPDGNVRRVAGVYDDEFVRESGQWRFARRCFAIVIEH
ncbi:MAG: nuclear transport factor 2 family protein [Polymorphobacter sp.]